MVASLRRAFRASVLGLGRAIEWGGTKFRIIGLWIEGLVSRRGDKSREKKVSLDDELNRTEFAHSIARYIANIDAESEGAEDRKSTTIGVYGGWGTGKTYLKNLVLRELEKMAVEVPFVEYNPWQWSGQEKLTESFFDTLESKFQKLGETDKPDAEKYKGISNKLRKLSLALSPLGPSPRNLAALQGLLLGAIGFLVGTFTSLFWGAWIYQTIAIVTVVGLSFWFLGNIFESIASWMEINASQSERNLDKVKEDLTELFADLDQPFLVVIDDIDRLTAEQIRMMMQLIKANADFPNVVYLVLFEREIVTGSLSDEENGIDGSKFLEKIVHLNFDLPKKRRGKIVEEFKKRLSRELESRDIPPPVVEEIKNTEQLFTVIDDFLHDFVRTLRDVNRVIPPFVFYLEHYIDQVDDSANADEDEASPSLEVNPGDLLALELLRIFDTEIHNRIPSKREVLENLSQFPTRDFDVKKEVLDYLLSPIDKNGDEGRKNRVRDTILFLFPHLREDADFILETGDLEHERRVSHPEIFGRYFERWIPEEALRKSQISSLLSTETREGAKQEFQDLVSQTDFKTVISAIDSRAEEVNADQARILIGVLFDEGDELRTSSGKGFELSESVLTLKLIQKLLRQRTDSRQQRGSVLIDALESTSGLYLPARVAQSAVNENRERRNTENREPLYREEDLDEVLSMVGDKIRDASANGNLIDQKHAQGIFHIWYTCVSQDEAVQWVEETCTKSAESFFQCLEKFNSASQSERIRQAYYPGMEGTPFSLDGEYLDKLDLLDIFVDAEKQMDTPDDLTDRQNQIIAEVRRVSEAMGDDNK